MFDPTAYQRYVRPFPNDRSTNFTFSQARFSPRLYPQSLTWWLHDPLLSQRESRLEDAVLRRKRMEIRGISGGGGTRVCSRDSWIRRY